MLMSRIKSIFQSRCFCAAHQVFPELLKKHAEPTRFSKKFIPDNVYISVRGGTGGQGCPSAGGIGGAGGNVYIKCVYGASLANFGKGKRRIVAGHGANYKRGKYSMNPGRNAFVVVPPGTVIKSADKELLYDMNEHKDAIKIASGGFGGSIKTTGWKGMKGEKKCIYLELKTIADVSLTGFPNAGKSSLLGAISRATPKVGNYSFTTINPMVGSVFYTDNKQVQVADLPGLIEDAHLNKGMGHKFLRHIERTNTVALVVDINGYQLNSDYPYRSPLETILILLKELTLYQDVLLTRPFLLVLNKMDIEDAFKMRDGILNELATLNSSHYLLDFEYGEQILQLVRTFVEDDFRNTLSVSAVNHYGLKDLKLRLYDSIHGDDIVSSLIS